MGERSEVVLVATKDWRKRADEAFVSRGRGSKKTCAKAVGCSAALVSRLVKGQVATSEFVGPISDWLGIPRPTENVDTEEQVQLLGAMSVLDKEQRQAILALALQMAKKSAGRAK